MGAIACTKFILYFFYLKFLSHFSVISDNVENIYHRKFYYKGICETPELFFMCVCVCMTYVAVRKQYILYAAFTLYLLKLIILYYVGMYTRRVN